MRIPILNFYHLLCYAWDRLEEGGIVLADAQEALDLLDLFARVLSGGVEQLLRRGVDREYVPVQEITSRPRGRIDAVGSTTSGAIPRGALCCHCDELSYDVIQNRIIRSSLRQLGQARGLNGGLKSRLAALHRRLNGVGELRITGRSFGLVRLHRNNQLYGFLLDVCRVIHDELMVDSSSGEVRFREFVRDDEKMRLLFQAFVRNFLRRRAGPKYRVGASVIPWQDVSGTVEALRVLPDMHTDVTVTSDDWATIIDTKYTPHLFDYPFGVRRLRAEHLFQISAYIGNYAKMMKDVRVRGLLLYPQVEEPVNLEVKVMGWPLRVCTIDMNQHWQGVEADLLTVALGQ